MHMKIKQNIRVVLQSAIATFFVAVVVTVAAQAATTIGNNVSTGTITATGAYTGTTITATGVVTSVGLTSTGIVDVTASSDTPLTVNGATSSTTLAVYNSSTGDLVNVIDGSTEVFTIVDGGNVGVGTSTPTGILSVNAPGTSSALVIGSSTATILDVKSTGVVHANDEGTSYVDLVWEGDTKTNLFVIDASSDRVGIGSSTPQALLSVGDPQANATSSIDVGLPCFKVKSYKGDGTLIDYYMWPDVDNTLGGWATSTTSCF